MAKGAFGPSFADSDDTDQLQSKNGNIETEREKMKRKDKRKLTMGELSAKCAACGLLGHTLPNYLYVFLEKARGKFHAREDQQEEVYKKLEENDQL